MSVAERSEGLPAPARIGIGGPVGSGKTALIERLIPALTARGLSLAVVTNDLVTREDAERVRRSGLIAPERVLAVETGACPHTAIREDPTLNIQAADQLMAAFPDLSAILIESGGDNLASTFSPDLVDYWIFVIDTAGGDDIPRKRGPGVVRCRSAGDQQGRSGTACPCRSGPHANGGTTGAPRPLRPHDQLRHGRGDRSARRPAFARCAV